MMTLMRHLDGLNLYAFCAMNPVTYVDPSGYAGTPKCGTGSESGSDTDAWKAIDEYRSRTNGLEPLGDTIPTRGEV